MTDEIERLRKEYNVAVANGLVVKARRIARSLKSLEGAKACACINGSYCYEGSVPKRCWIRDGRPTSNG